jgi:hypothetical protein
MIRSNARRQAATKPPVDEFRQDAPNYELFDDDPSVLPPVAAAPISEATLVGRICSHSRFGTGEIVAVSGQGDMATVTVAFAAAGTKKIKRRFLKIY